MSLNLNDQSKEGEWKQSLSDSKSSFWSQKGKKFLDFLSKSDISLSSEVYISRDHLFEAAGPKETSPNQTKFSDFEHILDTFKLRS